MAATAGSVWFFANGAKIRMIFDNVIFTTITNGISDVPATSTGVGNKQVQKARHCCIFYNKTHISLDFTIRVEYNKA